MTPEAPATADPGAGRTVAALWRAFRSVTAPPEFAPRPWTREVPLPAHPARDGLPATRDQLADLYVPDAPRTTGVRLVVLIHGGAFVIGDRRMKPARFFATELAARGFACLSLDYRLLFRGGRLNEALADVLVGVDAALALEPEPGAVAVLGLSAGGCLAALAAARRPTVGRVVGLYGLWDFASLSGRLARTLPRLMCRTPDRAAWAAASPMARPPHQPMLLVHGTADELVPVAQVHELAARRAAHGLETPVHIAPDAPHGFFNHLGPDCTAGLEVVVRFLESP